MSFYLFILGSLFNLSLVVLNVFLTASIRGRRLRAIWALPIGILVTSASMIAVETYQGLDTRDLVGLSLSSIVLVAGAPAVVASWRRVSRQPM